MEAIQKNKIEDVVYGRILENIKSDVWKAGDKLPSENELCRMLNVSRVSVRSALHRLKAFLFSFRSICDTISLFQ